MYYVFSGHFTGIILYLCVIHYDLSCPSISAYATPPNSSEEIKNIFNLPEIPDPILKGASKTGNFAEGGPINENLTKFSNGTFIKSLAKSLNRGENISVSSNFTERQLISSYSNSRQYKSHHTFELSTPKSLLPTKLTETGSNLFLGVPEVFHINGTSSIKPRKGVHCNKIVPRKGVDNENEASHDFSNQSLGNQSCLWLSENECYSTKELKDVECNCCQEGNTLGKAIKQQTPLNCKNCKSENLLFLESKQSCKSICCNSVIQNIYSVSTVQAIFNNNLNYQTVLSTEKQKQNSNVSQIKSNFQKNINSENSFVNSSKNFKLKPSVTKVPYDVEFMTELLSKDQQKVFVPILVSLFILPLIGILMFFLWRRTKEYWDKRYYRRMDFLIDGIYND